MCSGNCSASSVLCYLVSCCFALHTCIFLFNQCLKRIPLAYKDLLPRFPKFQIRFPYLCDTFLLHLGHPPRDIVQRALLDRMSDQPGLFRVFPSSWRLPFLLFVFLRLKTVVYVLSTFLVIYERKASSLAVIPLEPEADLYRMHFTR